MRSSRLLLPITICKRFTSTAARSASRIPMGIASRSLGGLLPATRTLLEQGSRPAGRDLANFLKHERRGDPITCDSGGNTAQEQLAPPHRRRRAPPTSGARPESAPGYRGVPSERRAVAAGLHLLSPCGLPHSLAARLLWQVKATAPALAALCNEGADAGDVADRWRVVLLANERGVRNVSIDTRQSWSAAEVTWTKEQAGSLFRTFALKNS